MSEFDSDTHRSFTHLQWAWMGKEEGIFKKYKGELGAQLPFKVSGNWVLTPLWAFDNIPLHPSLQFSMGFLRKYIFTKTRESAVKILVICTTYLFSEQKCCTMSKYCT